MSKLREARPCYFEIASNDGPSRQDICRGHPSENDLRKLGVLGILSDPDHCVVTSHLEARGGTVGQEHETRAYSLSQCSQAGLIGYLFTNPRATVAVYNKNGYFAICVDGLVSGYARHPPDVVV